GHRLGRLGRPRADRHLHAPSRDLPRAIARGEDRDTVDLAADLRGIVVEDDGDPETLPPEAPVVEERRAKVTEADERDRPLPIEPEDALELGLQARDVMADASQAELPEVSQVIPHLRRVPVEALGQVLRR